MSVCCLYSASKETDTWEDLMELDINSKVENWRAKAEAGTLTRDEMKEAIVYLRSIRKQATTKAKKKGTSKKVINSNELLNELEGL